MNVSRQLWAPLAVVAAVALLALTPAVSVFAAGGKDFIKDAIQSDLAGIELGNLAAQKGQSEAVRDFGETLSMDHRKALGNAKQIAEVVGVTPPDKLTTADRRDYDKLAEKSGSDFDKAFLDRVVDTHRRAVDEFGEVARKSDNPRVQQFAEGELPTLQKNLETARSLQSRGD